MLDVPAERPLSLDATDFSAGRTLEPSLRLVFSLELVLASVLFSRFLRSLSVLFSRFLKRSLSVLFSRQSPRVDSTRSCADCYENMCIWRQKEAKERWRPNRRRIRRSHVSGSEFVRVKHKQTHTQT
jgi:hypothetical protein